LLIDNEFENQCSIYHANGDCDHGHLNPFFTESEYYNPTIWEKFVIEDASGYEDGLGTLKEDYKFDS